VPVRNGGDDLAKLLACLSAQTLARERFEVIVADDGSSDGSTDGLDSADGWLTVLPGPPRNPYAARNRAAARAAGAVLAFCDADCRPEPTWLEAGLRALEDADLVAGLVRFEPPERRTVWALLDMETFLDQERYVARGRAVTANLFVTRERFQAAGGFDEAIANGGDQELVARCVAGGGRLVFAPDAVVGHPARSAASAFLGKYWSVHRRHGSRESRDRRRPDGLRLRAWVPVVSSIRGRRRAGRELVLDRKRLAASGVSPSWWDDVRAFPVRYLMLPYLAATAQVLGWWEGRGLRS
jgi:glycosyltransferase involved in cell wall biosynthesis